MIDKLTSKNDVILNPYSPLAQSSGNDKVIVPLSVATIVVRCIIKYNGVIPTKEESHKISILHCVGSLLRRDDIMLMGHLKLFAIQYT